MAKYKVGQIIEAKYKDVPPKEPYKIGQYVDVFDDETHEKLARFQVLKTDMVMVTGKIINTYRHKRRNV